MPLSSEERVLARALGGSIAAEASALAALYRERVAGLAPDGRDGTALAADAELLGAGNALAFVRQLERARSPKRDGARMGASAYAVRFPFSDRVARPGVRAWLLSRETIVDAPPSAGGSTLVYVRATPPSVALNAALTGLLVLGGKVTLVVDAAAAPVLSRALAGAGERIAVEPGDVAHTVALCGTADRVVAIAPEAERAALRAGKTSIGGYATDAPATYVVFPYYYDTRELRHLARQVAADVRAAPSGTTDVDVVVCRSWEQRALFTGMLSSELTSKGATGEEIPVRRVARAADALSPREGRVSFTILDTDAHAEFASLASAYLARPETSAHALSAFVHPLDLEKPARVREVDEMLAGTRASMVAINARPTLGYLLGAVPFGPLDGGAQNALRVAGHDRVIVEAPFHLAPCEARGWAAARSRFDRAPTFPRAVGLALRAIF